MDLLEPKEEGIMMRKMIIAGIHLDPKFHLVYGLLIERILMKRISPQVRGLYHY